MVEGDEDKFDLETYLRQNLIGQQGAEGSGGREDQLPLLEPEDVQSVVDYFLSEDEGVMDEEVRSAVNEWLKYLFKE